LLPELTIVNTSCIQLKRDMYIMLAIRPPAEVSNQLTHTHSQNSRLEVEDELNLSTDTAQAQACRCSNWTSCLFALPRVFIQGEYTYY